VRSRSAHTGRLVHELAHRAGVREAGAEADVGVRVVEPFGPAPQQPGKFLGLVVAERPAPLGDCPGRAQLKEHAPLYGVGGYVVEDVLVHDSIVHRALAVVKHLRAPPTDLVVVKFVLVSSGDLGSRRPSQRGLGTGSSVRGSTRRSPASSRSSPPGDRVFLVKRKMRAITLCVAKSRLPARLRRCAVGRVLQAPDGQDRVAASRSSHATSPANVSRNVYRGERSAKQPLGKVQDVSSGYASFASRLRVERRWDGRHDVPRGAALQPCLSRSTGLRGSRSKKECV
jgi:hypothetical protein